MKNRFKKTFTVIAALLILCFTLSACDPAHYYFKSEDLAEIVSIELVNYNRNKNILHPGSPITPPI